MIGQRIEQGFIDEVKRRTSLVELIGRDVTLKPAGREMKGLCPFHKERHGSFYVIEAKGFWHCFGCGKSGDAVRWVREVTDAKDFAEAVEFLAARCGLSQTGPSLNAKPIVQRDGEEALADNRGRKVEGAREIWARHQIATDWTAAGHYLRQARRIRIAIPPTIGFIHDLAHPFLRRGIGFPAMVAPIQAVDRKIVGVHCTYLAPGGAGKMACPPGFDPEDWKSKIMRGACWQGAIRLTPIEDLVVIAEGIETALSVLQALFDEEVGCPHIDGEPVAVWAAGSLGNMGAVLLPDGVREVILAADGDGKIPDAGTDQPHPEDLILAAAARHRDAGRNVRIARPPADEDFNDMLPAGVGAALAAEGVANGPG